MARALLVEGKTSTGKSRSIKGLDPKQTALILGIDKELPFKDGKKNYILRDTINKTGNKWVIDNIKGNKADYLNNLLNKISEELKDIKTIVIDDLQYIMSFDFIERIKENNWDKFNDTILSLYKILYKNLKLLRSDLTVIFITHTEQNDYDEDIGMKLIGKASKQYLTPEGLFTIVLVTQSQNEKDGVKYYFRTNGLPAKSPEMMFELLIENDLQLVLNKINEYYN